MSDLPTLLTMKEACRELGGIDRTTFYQWRRKGYFKVKRVGRRTFLPRTELERFSRTGLEGFHAGRRIDRNGNLEREDSVTAAAAH